MFVFVLAAGTARANDTHYQDFVVGSRAIGLGGAYTGIADDASGIWYNPAGIVDGRRSSVSISTNLYGVERGATRVDLGDVVVSADTRKVSFRDVNIIPATFGGVNGLGPHRADKSFSHAIGYALIVPQFRNFALFDDFTARYDPREGRPGGELRTSFTRRVQDRVLWAGLGYGYRALEWLSLGVSAFYVVRVFEQRESTSFARRPDGGAPVAFTATDTELNFFNGNLLLALGAKVQVTDRITAGATVMTPGLTTNADGTLKVVHSGSLPGPGGEPTPFFERPVVKTRDIDTRQPFRLRLGGAYVMPDRFTATLDLTIYGPVEYTLFAPRDPGSRRFLTILTDVRRKPLANVNTGFEYLFYRGLSLAAGFFTDFSSAPAVPRAPTRDMLPDVDLFGFTGALGWFSTYTLLRAGAMYSFGRGYDAVPEDRGGRLGEDAPRYERVRAAQSFLYLFVSSTFRY